MVEVTTPAMLLAAAAAARSDAVRLRRDADSQRTELRRTRRASRRQWETSIATSELRRNLRYRSSWSALDWQLPSNELDRVLVPHDGDS